MPLMQYIVFRFPVLQHKRTHDVWHQPVVAVRVRHEEADGGEQGGNVHRWGPRALCGGGGFGGEGGAHLLWLRMKNEADLGHAVHSKGLQCAH